MRKEEKVFIKRVTVAVSASIMALLGVIAYNHYKKYHHIDRGRPVAKVNGVKVYEKDLEVFLPFFSDKMDKKDLKIKDLSEEYLNAVVIETYINKIIMKLAKKSKITLDNEIKFFTQKHYERLVREKFLNKKILDNITEDDVVKRYQELLEMVKNREERKISHIVVETDREAEKIRNTIMRFNNFESMAKQKSLDRESAANGGSLGYVIKENIDIPEFAEIAFLLKVGELSKPIETKNGWHIIRVDDIRNMKTKTYEESKAEILEQIRQEKFYEFIDDIAHKPKIDFIRKFKKNNDDDKKNNEDRGVEENADGEDKLRLDNGDDKI
jgi:parvulin-like peptidyl-prolyl isomerase